MLRELFPIVLSAALLAGCARVPRIAPVAADNPANASAPSGKLFSNSDFLDVDAAMAQSAPLAVTAGADLPNPPATVQAGKATAPTAVKGMHGMNMSGGGMKNMPGMKMNASNQTEGQ
jgi:hypothetical protein